MRSGGVSFFHGSVGLLLIDQVFILALHWAISTVELRAAPGLRCMASNAEDGGSLLPGCQTGLPGD